MIKHPSSSVTFLKPTALAGRVSRIITLTAPAREESFACSQTPSREQGQVHLSKGILSPKAVGGAMMIPTTLGGMGILLL